MNRHVKYALATLARLPGKRFPIKGWSFVVEALHDHIIDVTTDTIHRTAYGVSLRLDLGDYIQRQIYYDAYETDELNFMVRILRARDVVLDVGANVGIFSLVAARAVGPEGEVHAFEPIPASYDRLVENVELNGFRNIRTNRAAVGAETGYTTLGLREDTPPSSGNPTSGLYAIGHTLRAAQAPMVRLDDYLAGQVAQWGVRLMKMDIEGFEPEALAGMNVALSAQRLDVLMIEVHVYTLGNHGFTVADLVKPVEAAGYRCYRLLPIGWLRRWRYDGEPPMRDRTTPPAGFIRNVWVGLQDINHHFDVIAIRGSHPAVVRNPTLLRASALVTDL